MRKNTGAARGARIAVRPGRADRGRIDEAVKTRGYTSPSAFIRSAIRNELNESARADRDLRSHRRRIRTHVPRQSPYCPGPAGRRSHYGRSHPTMPDPRRLRQETDTTC